MEGYKKLSSYILATVVCDLNVKFIKRWIDLYSRTRNQMEQAGRSGKQNIAEGYAMQSLEGYIKLLGVAQGSFKELAADYEDFLRQRDLRIYEKDSPSVRSFRAFRAIWVKDNILIPRIFLIALKKQQTCCSLSAKWKHIFYQGKYNL